MEYFDVALKQCIAYHGKTYEEALDTTLVEFYYLEEARKLKRQAELQGFHEMAWIYNQAKATKKSGDKIVSYFKDFKDFYDAEEEYTKAMYGKTEKTIQKASMVNAVATENRYLLDNEEIERQNRLLEEEIKRMNK